MVGAVVPVAPAPARVIVAVVDVGAELLAVAANRARPHPSHRHCHQTCGRVDKVKSSPKSAQQFTLTEHG